MRAACPCTLAGIAAIPAFWSGDFCFRGALSEGSLLQYLGTIVVHISPYAVQRYRRGT